MVSSGTAHSKIHEALKSSEPYQTFRSGELGTPAYQSWVEVHGREAAPSLNEDQANLSARFPRDEQDFVRRALGQCRAVDIIADDGLAEPWVAQAVTDAIESYDHGEYLTYIFPEEFALLSAIVRQQAPKRAVFMGSYYGYWAMAAKIACRQTEVFLMDINPAVMELAASNFKRRNLAAKVHFMVGDAEKLVSSVEDIDLLVLDAEGPKSECAPEDYRDKAIYYPHLKAAFKQLAPGALVVAHNVILSNFSAGSYFDLKQKSYREQYRKFIPFVKENFTWTVVDSTEGTLVAKKL